MTSSLDIRERLSAEYDDKGRRFYRAPDGSLVPSVTTFLDVIAKPALENWKREQVVTWAIENLADWATLDYEHSDPPTIVTRFDQETTMRLVAGGGGGGGKRKAGHGTVIHNLFERRLLLDRDAFYKDVTVPEQFESAMRWFEEFLEMYKVRPYLIESELLNKTYAYGGSLDLGAYLNGPGFEDDPLTVVDYKSGTGIFWDTVMQLMAYAKAEEVLGLGPMPEIKALAGLWVRPEGWALYRFEFSPRIWTAVVGARHIFSLQEDGMRVRGKAVNPGALKYKGSDW